MRCSFTDACPGKKDGSHGPGVPRRGDPIKPNLKNVESAEEAWESVLLDAGAFPHDATSARMVHETRTGTGKQGYLGDIDADREALKRHAHPAPADSDGDGIPDSWEQKLGLNPADSADSAEITDSGYSMLEHYCHALARALIQRPANRESKR